MSIESVQFVNLKGE